MVGSTSTKFGAEVSAAASMSVSQAKRFFVQGKNTEMKITGDIVGISATGWNTLTAREWAALIGYCGVEIWKQAQKNWKHIKKSLDAMEVRTIVVTAIKEQQIDVNIQSIQVWFGDDVTEDILECRFTYRPMANMAKTEHGILFIVYIHFTAQ